MLKYLKFVLALILVLSNTATWAGKPVANKPPTVSITSPANGATFAPPATINLSVNAADSDGTIARVEYYRGGTTLIGSNSTSPFGLTWSGVAAGSYSLTAKAFDNGGASTISTAVSITVATPPASQVVISSPANGATVYGETMTVAGTFVGDPATTTVWVDNGNSTRLATLSGNSFSATLPLYPGANTINVSVARRDKTSDSASVTVNGNDYPKIAFKSPTTALFNAPANITFAFDAVSPNGSISTVALFDGATQLWTSTAPPPYTFTWNNVPAGNHTVTAQATDNLGYMAGASTTVNVLGPNILPTVSLTSPTAGATFVAPATITLTANAADSDGTVKQVEFMQGGSVLSATNVSPYTYVWPNVAVGTYSLSARATDDRGGSTTSAPVSITVVPANALPSVSLTAPQDGASYYTADLATPVTISLAATASDSDGTINRVEFYQGASLIGSSATPPYAMDWSALQGSYVLTAKAIDDQGGISTSAPVNVTVKSNETITYLHDDFAGSAIAATDSNGAIVWKESYRPYGDRQKQEAAASGNRQWFHGKPVDDDTGLSYFGARYYDASLGRFMGIDSVSFKEDNLHSFNRYAYGNNNPYKFVDPDGREGRWANFVESANSYFHSQEFVNNMELFNTMVTVNEGLSSVAGLAPGAVVVERQAAMAVQRQVAAEVARDTLSTSLAPMKGKAPATVTGGFNTKTGEVAARACGGGKCAEDHVVEALGGSKADVRFTKAVRPRTGEQVPVCKRCEEKYGRESFPTDTKFQSDH